MRRRTLGDEIVKEVIRQVSREFKVSKARLFQSRPSKENFLRLMVICLAAEVSSPRKPGRAVVLARKRFKKYLQWIPGLQKKYDSLKSKIIERVGGF